MDDSTIQPAPPDLAGLRWQALTPDDLSAIADLAEACRSVDGGLAIMTMPASLKERLFTEAPGAAIGPFSADGRLEAYSAVRPSSDGEAYRAVVIGQVRPTMRNRGIGTYLMQWSLSQSARVLAGAPAGRRVVRVVTESWTAEADRLYRAHGFERIFEELVMQRDLRVSLPERPLPPGVLVVNWEPDLAEQFFQAYAASFRDRPGFPGWSAAEWIAWAVDEYSVAEWSLLARSDGVPVGFLTAALGPPEGFVSQVGVVPAMRRRGLGSALLVESMRRMQAAGAPAAILTVATNNPGAIRTYEKLGFVAIGRRARYERPA